jgi:DNA-binding HxlR family transcriptional regulator
MSRRTYNQYCATARALDIVGERWTLLLVRELLTGPKRFGDLSASLTGMGAGLLAARLKYLQDEGVVRQVTLPPPARTPAYALTEAGADLREAVLALARWGMTWTPPQPTEGELFRPGWLVLGLQAIFDAEAAAGMRVVYEFRVDDEVFHVRIEDGAVETVHGPAQRPDVVVTAAADAFIDLMVGGVSMAEAVRAGGIAISGDQRTARRLRSLFRRPRPRVRGGHAST